MGTSVRSATDCAGAKKLETSPISAITRAICGTPWAYTSKSARTPRIRSLAIITRLTRQRSTSTPASGPTIATGSMYETITTATSAGVPCSLNVIRLMTAKMARKSPKMLTNCAIQMVRKAGCWRTLGTRFHNTCYPPNRWTRSRSSS